MKEVSELQQAMEQWQQVIEMQNIVENLQQSKQVRRQRNPYSGKNIDRASNH